MNHRIYDIHIRVTEQEKRRMETQAKQAGLTLSAYLRRAGTGEDVRQPSPMELFAGLEEGAGYGYHEDLAHKG